MIETFLEFLTAWGTSCGEAGFIAEFDFDNNCNIGTSDLLQYLTGWGAEDATPGAVESARR